MSKDTTTSTPTAIVNSLNPDEIRERLDELDREASALRVLLRAAIARQRPSRQQEPASK